MKQHLRDLLSNNVPPSEDILREVEENLVIPRQKLFETESEIRKLKNQLKFLESKREDIQKSIDEYRPITIPIRRIPPDILAEIFYHCLPSHRNPILSGSEAPVLLTHVCSSWRSLALSSPRLWARVHITFNDEYIGPYNIQDNASEMADDIRRRLDHIYRVLKLRCDVVKDWLARSGHCPLSISFLYTTRLTGLHELMAHFFKAGDPTFQIFQTMVSFSRRWNEIELVMPKEMYPLLGEMISDPIATLPVLRSVRASINENMPDNPSGSISFFAAPFLQQLSIAGHHTARFYLTPTKQLKLFADNGQRLTHLNCHNLLGIEECFSLLMFFKNLVHCQFGHVAEMPLIDIPGTPGLSSITGTAHLPHLLVFCLKEDYPNYDLWLQFFSSIEAPKLKWIEYQQDGNNLFSNLGMDNAPSLVPPIAKLLLQSTQLEKLSFDPRNTNEIALRSMLDAVSPTLKHLVLGSESQISAEWKYRSEHITSYSLFRFPKSSQFNVEWLVVDSNETALVLFPHLEKFESAFSLPFDEALFRFITSRKNPARAQGISELKFVRVLFQRTPQIDITQEMVRYREDQRAKCGVEICDTELRLSYEPANLSVRSSLSPSFTLEQGRPSWGYPDIDASCFPG